MSNASVINLARDRFRSGLAELSGKWGWYFALGVFLVILGFVASGMAVATTMLTVTVLGWILLGGGASLVILSFLTGRWSGFLLSLAAGVLSIIAGVEMLTYPVSSTVVITMIIGTLLMAAGIFRTAASIAMRFPGWGWAFASGIVAFGLGVFLLRGLPNTSLWFIGLAVGVDLILHGFSWMMFSVGLHSLARDLRITEADRRAA